VKLLFWGLVIVGLGYAAYSGMIVAWSWIAVNNAVDEVLSKDGVEALPEKEIRARVLTSTNEAGVPLNERDVSVTRDNRLVRVEVVWTIPVIVVRGEALVEVPLAVRRASTGMSLTR
jgi:hypothetical protein